LNGGMGLDFSQALCNEYNDSLDGPYYFANLYFETKTVLTNIPSKTAQRSFGHIQATVVSEGILEEVAIALNKSFEEVKEINFYTERNCITPYGQFMEDLNVVQMWAGLKESSKFFERKAEVELFNQNNRFKKRGISMIGQKYGMSYMYGVIGTHALVNVNPDGTVVVFHGGAEIGQGIHTKVAQIVAMTIGCPVEKVRVGYTDTDVIPTMGFTGGSVTSEACVEAARQASLKLNSNFNEVRQDFWKKDGKDPEWTTLVAEVKKRGLQMTETGIFQPIGRENSKRSAGGPFNKFFYDYYTCGVASSEVEVDLLTGEINILRSDIVFDVGTTINGLIDLGQAEGAFVMGLGYFFREGLLIKPTGEEEANSTWEYKPPSSLDIPIDFRVKLLTNAHPGRVCGLKGIGEPPMILSYSAASAVKYAIHESRKLRGIQERVQFNMPLTIDVIQTSCGIRKEDLILDS